MAGIKWTLKTEVSLFGKHLNFLLVGKSADDISPISIGLEQMLRRHMIMQDARYHVSVSHEQLPDNPWYLKERKQYVARRNVLNAKGLLHFYPTLTSITREESYFNGEEDDNDEIYLPGFEPESATYTFEEPEPEEILDQGIGVSASGFVTRANTSKNNSIYDLLEELVFRLPVDAVIYDELITARKKLGLISKGDYQAQKEAVDALQREDSLDSKALAFANIFGERLARLDLREARWLRDLYLQTLEKDKLIALNCYHTPCPRLEERFLELTR